jgi:hypothetical protein
LELFSAHIPISHFIQDAEMELFSAFLHVGIFVGISLLFYEYIMDAKADKIPTKTHSCKKAKNSILIEVKSANVCREQLQLCFLKEHILKWYIGLCTEKGRCERNYL